ncbi:PDDEXK family nuclease [Mucilaginibacter sp.]
MNLKFAYEVESIYNIEVSTYKIAQLEEWDYLFNKLNSKYKPIARKCHMTSFTKCLTQKANVAEMKPNRGYCESYFSGFLSKYFSEYIYWGLALPVVDYNYFQLYPDFLLYLPKHNLHVAIEIDEYYTQIDNTPIHYCDDNFPYTRKDENNERYYAKAHWFVIRFSEDQVIFTPNECCQEINKFINEIIYPASIECLYIEKDLDISRPVWTYCGALKLANDNEREKGFEYIHSVNPFYNSKGNSVLKNAKDYEMDYQIHDRSKSEQFIYLLERTIPIDFSQYLEAWIVGYKKEYKEDDELPF